MYEDEIWDEHRWEAYLRENDERVDRFMDLLFGFLVDFPMPEPGDLSARSAWEAHLRAFLMHKGLEPGEHPLTFLFDEDEDEPEDEGFFLEDDLYRDDEPYLDDEAEEGLVEPFQDLPIYQQALALTSGVLDWAHALPVDLKDSSLVQYCTHLMQVPANIAKGHSIGYERDMIGGNIACVKRGLYAANEALKLLRELKGAPNMTPPHYRRLYEQTYELRNAIGLYVQDLRHRFELGID